MAAIAFDNSPSNGDTVVANGVTYTYNSAETKWKTTINSNAFLPLSGGTVTGNILMGGEIQHQGDTDTNIAFDTDTILFDTAGSERFRVGSAGQLGIGGATYGTSGQVLTSGGASAAPSWADAAGISVARITDSKTSGTAGGTFTSGAWRTRDLNTIEDDPDSIVTLSSNQFTLGAGTYLIQWSAPVYRVNSHKTQLYDVTGATDLGKGSSEYSNNGDSVQTISVGSDVVTLTANNTFEIQHQCQTTVSGDGFGVAASFAAEKYTMVTIFKLS